MAEAPSKPCKRDFASACAVGSKFPLPKTSSDEMAFWLPNLFRANLSSSSTDEVSHTTVAFALRRVRTLSGSFDGPNRAEPSGVLLRRGCGLVSANLTES